MVRDEVIARKQTAAANKDKVVSKEDTIKIKTTLMDMKRYTDI